MKAHGALEFGKFVGVLAVLCVACRRESAPSAKKDPTPTVSITHPGGSPIAAKPIPSPYPTASASCAPLAWDPDQLGAAPATFVGRITETSGSLPNGSMETFYVMTLEVPSCDAEGAPTSEIQVYSDDDDFKKAFLHRARIVGEPMAWMTAHHHRPIVVHVTKLAIE